MTERTLPPDPFFDEDGDEVGWDDAVVAVGACVLEMLADGAGEVTVRRSGDDGFVISDDSEDEEGADGTAP